MDIRPLLAVGVTLLSGVAHGAPLVFAPTLGRAAGISLAAHAGLEACTHLKTVGSLECAFAVVETADGGYRTTPLVCGERDHFELRVKLASGERIVGLAHTHPGRDLAADRFSGDDIAVAKAFNVPSFIWVVEAHHARLYQPSGRDSDLGHVLGGSATLSKPAYTYDVPTINGIEQ